MPDVPEIVLGCQICYFDAFLQNRQKPTIKSSNTDHFAYVGAPGVLKTAPACILNSFCTYLIIVGEFNVIFDLFSGGL